MEDNNRYDFVL